MSLMWNYLEHNFIYIFDLDCMYSNNLLFVVITTENSSIIFTIFFLKITKIKKYILWLLQLYGNPNH